MLNNVVPNIPSFVCIYHNLVVMLLFVNTHGGVKYTVKDGIIYDAKRLLKEVKEMVDKKKA